MVAIIKCWLGNHEWMTVNDKTRICRNNDCLRVEFYSDRINEWVEKKS